MKAAKPGAAKPRPRAASAKKGKPRPAAPAAHLKRERIRAVLKQFRAVVSSVKRHYQSVQRASGVSGAQLWAMSEIGANPGIKVGQLAKELAIHQSTMSNMLDRLEELRLITRERIADDRRVVTVFLTPNGAKSLKAAPKPTEGVLQSALSTLSGRRLQSLHQHLDEVVHALKLSAKSDTNVLLSDSLADD